MAFSFEVTRRLFRAPGHTAFLAQLPPTLSEKALLMCKNPAERVWVEQALLRQRYRDKLPTFCNHPEVILPPALHLQQASSEAVATYRARQFSGNLLLDITTGMGADLCWMSAPYESAQGWEKHGELAASAQYNLHILGRKATVHPVDALPLLGDFPKNATVFMDPDRRAHAKGPKADFSLHQPNPVEVWQTWKGKVILKAGPMTDVQALLLALPGADGIEIIAWKGDVREVLITRSGSQTISLRTTRLETGQTLSWSAELLKSHPPLSPPLEYLFDPFPEVHKAGVYGELCRRYGLFALGASTRLFTGSQPMPDFPGRIYKNLGFVSQKSKERPQAARVLSRNHPESPESIRKAWKLKESETYLIAAVTDISGSKKYIAGELWASAR